MLNLKNHSIQNYIEKQDWSALHTAVHSLPPAEIAEILMVIEKPEERVILFRMLPKAVAADVAAQMEPDDVNALLKHLTDDETRRLLAHLSPDDRTSLFEELPGRLVQGLISLLSPEDLKEARTLLGYPEMSVGRLMTPDYVAVRPEWTVGQALEHIRQKGTDSETVNMIFVVDAEWNLLDTVELRKFILAGPETPVRSIMDCSFVSMRTTDDREKAVEAMRKYDLIALPVVDSDGVLVGIVTADDIMDVAQEEATEDFQKSAAVAPLEHKYSDSTVLGLFRKRIGWLLFLIFLNLVSSGVIAFFEKTLASAIALAFFMPLLIDSGGNAGSQAATLVVRGLATGDLRPSDWMRTLIKELAVGGVCGAAMGAASWAMGTFRGGVEVALVVGLSMAAVVLVANVIGTMLPFALTRIGIDPAVASSPLITTIADSAGLLIYFTLARAILGIS